MNDRAKAAADRIREVVPITQVLATYGYRVRADGGHREQQFSCDLHGSGRDNKPSARVYPESNSWFCFACNKTRDVIETVRAKEDVTFWKAIKILETTYGLDPLPIDYGTDDQSDIRETVRTILDADRTFEQDRMVVQIYLDRRTRDQDIPLDTLLRFWEAFDRIIYHVRGPSNEGGVWTEVQGRTLLLGLKGKIDEAVNEQRKST